MMEQRKRDDALELLRELHDGSLSKHRSCWLHLAAYRQGKGKITEKDMVEIKEKFGDTSPCLTSLRVCRKRSSSRRRGLSGQRWKMSGGVFDDHLENIWRSLSDEKKASCTHVNSLCFFLYKNKKHQALDLIKRKDIFSKKYAFIPIVCWDHWRLLVFCHFGENADSATQTRCILLLDSSESCAQVIGPDMRRFVFDIFKAEGRPESKDTIYQIPLLVPKVPQQTNEFDCGRFVLYFIKEFIEAAPDKFSISNGYPYFLKRDWFDYDSFGRFCDKLERGIPTCKEEVCTSRRKSQRIRNGRTSSQEASRQNVEIMVIDA